MRLISLALWTYRYSAKVMSGEASPQPLIDLNREIMAGLKGSGAMQPEMQLAH